MEISEIKRCLRIGEVLSHYGLKPDRNQRLLCPFHADKTPSLQIYPSTDTFCCFSTNCKAGTGDVIRLIELLDKGTKHEAIVKAQSLIGATAEPPRQPTPVPGLETDLDRQAVLAKAYQYFKAALPGSKKAVAYLEGRGLDYKQHDIGYNSGSLHTEAQSRYLVEGMVKAGLLKPHAVKGYNVWAKDCVIFPLRDRDHKVVSLYGRSLTNDTDQRHFYLVGRTGLYPGYPEATTKKLILTESVIDAASLLQQEVIQAQYSILALYGTNGLTDEHIEAIRGLDHLAEITLLLDGDDAGAQATAKHAHTLRDLRPGVRITRGHIPEGEDVNSLLESHADPRVLLDLVASRTDFYFSMEPMEPTPHTPTTATGLDTRNAELLVYDHALYRIEVLGGIKLPGLDRLRVTLKVACKTKPGLPAWHSLDLYNHGQREQLITSLADAYDTNVQATAEAVGRLTEALEGYRRTRIEALQTKTQPINELTPARAQAAITALKSPGLLDHTGRLLGESGITGEEANRLIAYLVYTTRKSATPLHVMFMGASGSGKTYLQERVSELIPTEDRIGITQITGNALYYFQQEELKHKLILIEDLDGAQDVFYPLRELQTKRRITKTVTLKDAKGNLKTITLTVEGPVCVSGCTTREKLYEDNANRCILLYIDGSKEQDRRITEHQALAASGGIDRAREDKARGLLQDMQRVLKPVRVLNPYAKHLQLPEAVFKPRRTMTLLLGFIEAVTFYHQYQRMVKRDREGVPYIETTPADIADAFGLLKEVLFAKSDELAKATRSFLEYLKGHLTREAKETFTAREVRVALRIPPSTLKRYLVELERYGYLKAVGNRYRSYAYSVTSMEEYEALKRGIDLHLEGILERIKEETGSPVAH